jgi:hypothetical protein
MMDEAPLGNPFIGEPRYGRPRYVARWPAHVAKSPLISPQGAVVVIKRKIVEGKEGKRGGRWPSGHS